MKVLKGYIKVDDKLLPINSVDTYTEEELDTKLLDNVHKDNGVATNVLIYDKKYIGSDTVVDLSKGLVQLLSSSTITLPNTPEGGSANLTIICTSDAVTWSGPIVWFGGYAPSFEGNVNVVNFISIGSTWYGFYNSGINKDVAIPDYTKAEYTTPGTYTLDVPAGATKVKLTIAGAGGGGGGGKRTSNMTGKSGGAGGTGGLNITTVSITTYNSITITVGSGGTGGHSVTTSSSSTPGSAGTNGGSSSVSFGTQTYTATGGKGGTGGSDSGAGTNGANGTPSGEGGAGGTQGTSKKDGENGSNGWVYIEYGFGIE